MATRSQDSLRKTEPSPKPRRRLTDELVRIEAYPGRSNYSNVGVALRVVFRRSRRADERWNGYDREEYSISVDDMLRKVELTDKEAVLLDFTRSGFDAIFRLAESYQWWFRRNLQIQAEKRKKEREEKKLETRKQRRFKNHEPVRTMDL